MSSLIVVPPFPMQSASSSGGEASAANLLTANPKEAFSSPGSDRTITIITGPLRMIDTIFLGFIDIANGTNIIFTSLDGQQDGPVQRGTVTIQRNGSRLAHALVKLPAPVRAAGMQIGFYGAANVPMTAGVFAMGRSFQPAGGREWGSGRRVIDTGSKERLLSGAFGVNPGARAGAWSWSMADLSDVEVESLYDMVMDLGETGDVLVVEDPDQTAGLNNRIHWGKFGTITPYERMFQQHTRWEFNIEDWA